MRVTDLTLSISILLAGCPGTAPEEDEPGWGPVVVHSSPAPGAADVFGRSVLEVEFGADLPPTSVGLSLAEVDGQAVVGQVSSSTDGLSHTFVSEQDLAPSTEHILTVDSEPGTWPPVEIPFTTSPHGQPLGEAAADLVGLAFSLNLGTATWVEPPALGAVMVDLLGYSGLGFVLTGDSSFDPDAQPGLHVLGLLTRQDGQEVVQDPCVPVIPGTFGADGLLGTEDDTPARWIDPEMTFGPEDVTIVTAMTDATIDEFEMGGVLHPDGLDLRGVHVAGRVDTRGLDTLLSPSAEEGAICDFLESVTIPCQACDDGGAFCLDVRVEDVVGQAQAGLEVEPLGCADVIELFVASGGEQCADEAATWDPVGDASYAACPGWAAR